MSLFDNFLNSSKRLILSSLTSPVSPRSKSILLAIIILFSTLFFTDNTLEYIAFTLTSSVTHTQKYGIFYKLALMGVCCLKVVRETILYKANKKNLHNKKRVCIFVVLIVAPILKTFKSLSEGCDPKTGFFIL